MKLFNYILILCAFHLSTAFTVNAQYLESSQGLGVDHISVSPNLIGGGVTSFDYNNDGWQDLYFTSGINKDHLYKNINGERFELVDVPELSLTSRFNTSGVIAADFNNDGCSDLLVTTLSIDPTLLLINNCDETFSAEFLHIVDEDGEYVSSSGAFASDFDQDGLLDIYLINYVKEHHFLEDSIGRVIGYDHDCYRNSILMNQDQFKFETILGSSLSGSHGCTLAGSSSRFLGIENNGAYIVNDFGEWIYPNEIMDTTVDSTTGLDEAIYGMGVAISDFDNDEDYDLYLTNIGKNRFLVNNENNFENQAATFDIENELNDDSTSVVSWGTMFLDYNNDGAADLFVSNGFVPVPEFLSSSIVNQNKLYQNNNGEFVDITEPMGLASNGIHRGSIYTDINNDGLLDIIASVVSDSDLGTNDIKRTKIFVNKLETDNEYLQIYLEGFSGIKDGFNTEVKIYIGDKIQSQILFSGTSFASQNFPALHFGLAANESIDSLKVLWPSGEISLFENVAATQKVLAREGHEQLYVLGCTDIAAPNYMEAADVNFGCIKTTTSTSEDFIEESGLTIFPNPSAGQFMINTSQFNSLSPLNISVYNTLGQLVNAKTALKKTNFIELDLSVLNSGIYFLKVSDIDNNYLVKKIEIKK